MLRHGARSYNGGDLAERGEIKAASSDEFAGVHRSEVGVEGAEVEGARQAAPEELVGLPPSQRGQKPR